MRNISVCWIDTRHGKGEKLVRDRPVKVEEDKTMPDATVIASTSLPPLLREKEVTRALGVSRTTLWEGVKRGRYPQPIKISAKRVMWRADALARLVDQLTPPEQL
jgi:predicted DNA-binding transcriptional regulator AlpA